jgi:AraC-like DNA-binding protein
MVVGERGSVSNQESIGFRRAHSLPGVEVLDALNTGHRFRWFHTAIGFGMPTTWHGVIQYRGRQQELEPGKALCTAPGELSAMPRILNAGSFNALMIEPDAFQSYAAEHGIRVRAPEWRASIPRTSPGLARRFASFLRLLEPHTSPMELQSSVVDLFEAWAAEVLDGGQPGAGRNLDRRTPERLREMLHSSDGTKLDLSTLAATAGMTRFQVLRSFKQRYGLPPHAYQLCAQLGRARDLLRGGRSATEVAMECGFADQSHFGRHFKRIFGVTPGTYAKAKVEARHRNALAALSASDRKG